MITAPHASHRAQLAEQRSDFSPVTFELFLRARRDDQIGHALSLIFVVLQYFDPGMMKTVVTLRAGNAWVHAIAYFAAMWWLIAPNR
jgi:hypothetical protein